jgi:peptidoglycan/LPS O-acetylase OafA/YrhL
MSRYADMHGGNVGARTDIIFTSLLIPALFAIWARRIGVAERFPGWLVWVCLGLSQVVVYSFPGAAGHELPCLELYLVIPVLFTVMIISTVQNPDSVAGRFLELRPLRFVGRISFSIYLYQQLFFLQFTPKSTGWLGTLQRFPIDYFCSLVLAILSYYLIEKPFIRWGHRLTRKPLPLPQDSKAPA